MGQILNSWFLGLIKPLLLVLWILTSGATLNYNHNVQILSSDLAREDLINTSITQGYALILAYNQWSVVILTVTVYFIYSQLFFRRRLILGASVHEKIFQIEATVWALNVCPPDHFAIQY